MSRTIRAAFRICALPAILGCFLAVSCSRRPPDLLERTLFAPPDSEAAWARYHWYAADLRYGFSSRSYTDNGYNGIRSFTEFSLVAKVLTTEGSQIGTIPLPGMNRNLLRMDVMLYDSLGARVPFDRAPLDSIFRAASVLVVPKVTRGCVVAVRIKQGPYGPFNYFEYPVDLNAPVNRATFAVSFPKGLRYDGHGYHGMNGPADSVSEGIRHLTWTAERVMPVPALDFLDRAATRPKLLVVSRYNREGDSYKDWPSVAKNARKVDFKHNLLTSRGKAGKRAKALAKDAPDAKEAARRILEWVQENITFEDEERAVLDPDDVLEAQRGSRWQMATLLSAMYEAVGLGNEIVLSRPREYGGLDPDAPNPNAVWEPLVAVTAGGREWAACAHERWQGLGGYSEGLFGMQALSLESGNLRSLPPPVPDRSSIEAKEIWSAADPGHRTLELALDGIAAAQARRVLQAEGLTPAACGRFLGSLGFDPVPETCAEEDLDRRDRPVRLRITAKAAYLILATVKHPRVKLEGALSRAAWFYDSARVEEYSFPYEIRRRETVVLREGGPGGTAETAGGGIDLACVDRKNAVFEISCRRTPIPGGTMVIREVVIRPGRHPAAALRALHAEIMPLALPTPAVVPRP